MKVSVLIPVFNYDLALLLSEFYEQLNFVRVDCEVICLDDGSDKFRKENSQWASQFGFEYIVQENMGRSISRNKLAAAAQGEWLLFLDCDSRIARGDFLKRYLEAGKNADVVYGGTCYDEKYPGKEFALHWKYGRKVEAADWLKRKEDPYRSFKTNNFFVKHSIFKRHSLDEDIRKYGYEDLLWAQQLKEDGIEILHIDNPVFHRGLNSTEVFLQNTSSAIDNLVSLHQGGKIGRITPLLKWHHRLKKLSLTGPFLAFYKMINSLIVVNLNGPNPWLFFFSLYKLAAICRAWGKGRTGGNSE